MRYLLIFVLLHWALAAGAQSYYKELPVPRASINYPDHTITASLIPVKNKVRAKNDRLYYWYSANTISITQGGYSGKLLNGLYTDLYKNKNLKEQGSFRKGLKSGTWKRWTPEGKPEEMTSWKNGHLSGSFIRYHSDGTRKEQGRYTRGVLQGKHTEYLADDSTRTSYYKGGELYVKRERKIVPAFIKRWIKAGKKGKVSSVDVIE